MHDSLRASFLCPANAESPRPAARMALVDAPLAVAIGWMPQTNRRLLSFPDAKIKTCPVHGMSNATMLD